MVIISSSPNDSKRFSTETYMVTHYIPGGTTMTSRGRGRVSVKWVRLASVAL